MRQIWFLYFGYNLVLDIQVRTSDDRGLQKRWMGKHGLKCGSHFGSEAILTDRLKIRKLRL